MTTRSRQLPRYLYPVFAIIANIVPLYGIWFWGWKTFDIIFLYWLENVVIGVFTVARMVIRPYHNLDDVGETVNTAPFFILHYGMFCAVHGTLVFSLFGTDAQQASGLLGAFALTPEVLQGAFLFVGAIALLLLNLGDFLRAMYEGGVGAVDPQKLMAAPYARIVVLHGTLLASGFLLLEMEQPVAGILALVVIKTLVDIVKWRSDEKALDAGMVTTKAR